MITRPRAHRFVNSSVRDPARPSPDAEVLGDVGADLFFGEGHHSAVGVMDHDELVHVELAPRDDQGAERVVGGSAAGVADEVGVADRDAERVLGAEAMSMQVTIASMTGDGAAAPWVVPYRAPRDSGEITVWGLGQRPRSPVARRRRTRLRRIRRRPGAVC